MNAAPIELTSRFDYDTLRVGFWWHNRQPRWVRRLLTPLILFFAGCMVCFVALRLLPVIKAAPLILAAGWMLLRDRIYGWFFYRSLRKHPGYGQEMHWRFDDDGLTTKMDSGSAMLQWSAIYGSVLTADGALIYQQQGLFFWIPVAAFQNADDFERLTAILKEKTKWKTKT